MSFQKKKKKKKKAEVGDARTVSAFRFRYANSPVATKKCAVVASLPAPQQATVCVRTMYYLSIFLFLQCEYRSVHREGGGVPDV